jgi:hypothetical protein
MGSYSRDVRIEHQKISRERGGGTVPVVPVRITSHAVLSGTNRVLCKTVNPAARRYRRWWLDKLL